jgi:hypothetical protein
MALDVSEAWLMGYEVSMDRGEEENKKVALEEQLLTEDEKWLLQLYRQVPKERRQVVLAMISAALEAERL